MIMSTFSLQNRNTSVYNENEIVYDLNHEPFNVWNKNAIINEIIHYSNEGICVWTTEKKTAILRRTLYEEKENTQNK